LLLIYFNICSPNIFVKSVLTPIPFDSNSPKAFTKSLWNFINVLTAGQEGTVAVVEGKLKKETIDKNVAPIISRIQIKTTDIGSSEPGEFYTIKPLEIAIEPSKGFFPDFISTIQIPTWFVINKNSKSLDDFTNKFKENFDNVTIPKKVSALGF